MKTPAFWYEKTSLLSTALAPAAALYQLGARVRTAVAPASFKAKVPVICVGNCVAGGAGKTPVSLALIDYLKKRGDHPVAALRGYGGSEKGPIKVDPLHHTAAQVGDEALLLAMAAPCWIGANRAEAVYAAAECGDGPVVMDDGFQNPTVHKDISLLVIDGATGFGNGSLLPAGPLREEPQQAIERATAILLIGEDKGNISPTFAGKPILRGKIVPDLPMNFDYTASYLAFSGIARPQKFFDTCEQLGLGLVEKIAFPDHHNFTKGEWSTLVENATHHQAKLLTTSKDWVRLSSQQKAQTSVLPVKLVLDDEMMWNLLF